MNNGRLVSFAGLMCVVSACGAQPDRSQTPPPSQPQSEGSRVVSITTSSSSAAAPAAVAETAEPEPAPAEPEQLEMPTECAEPGKKPCLPPVPFVEKLCRAKSVDFALSMFRKSTPWTRA